MKSPLFTLSILALIVAMGGSVYYFRMMEDKLEAKEEQDEASKEEKDMMESLVEQQAENREEFLETRYDEAETFRKITAEKRQIALAEEAARLAEEVAKNKPKDKHSFYDRSLRRRLSSLPSLPRRTIVAGKPIPFEVAVPPSWKMISWDDPVVAVLNEQTLIRLEVGPWVTSMDEYLEITLDEIKTSYPMMEIVGEENVVIDGKTWKHIVLRGQVTGFGDDHEMSMLVYGSRRGSYRFIVEGHREDLQSDARDVTLMLTSFRFPPDNFEPAEAKGVRVYVDGERVDF